MFKHTDILRSRNTAALTLQSKSELSSLTEITLADHNKAALELLLGALHFMQDTSEQWLTWVAPPKPCQTYFAGQELTVNKLRLVYQDQQRSVFHLLYLALQAANSSWVIGPAQGLTFRQTQLLEQAAIHNGCRLLLIHTKSDLKSDLKSELDLPIAAGSTIH